MTRIIECPRDAMQGIEEYIPTATKVNYINKLLKVGFDTIDFGSFVSPKSVPQMRDTADVLRKLNLNGSSSFLLAIVANLRGAEDAVMFDEIDFLGFPFSVSETFQKKNTNSTIDQSLTRVEEIYDTCVRTNKELIIYLSMAFGNPYGDPWNFDEIGRRVEQLTDLGVNTIALSDTVGVSNPDNIKHLYSNLTAEFPFIEFGAHLHSSPDSWHEKIQAAYDSGCRRFDAAIKGWGGMPYGSR
jgi:hydroxymethylglutaryl-CoA lyase